MSKNYGVGLDLGTMNIVSARKGSKGVDLRRIRDAFLDLDLSAKKMLKLSGVDFIERENEILLIGDAALDTANVLIDQPGSIGCASITSTHSSEPGVLN